MDIKKELINKLNHQLEIEILSRESYSGFLNNIKDKRISDTISKIRDEEREHIVIVEGMIDAVKRYDKPLKAEDENLLKERKYAFEKSNVVLLLLGSVDKYMHEVISIVKENVGKKKIVYLSYNKFPKYIKKILQEQGVSLNRVLFINCTGKRVKEDISLSPEDLTQISITVGEAAEKAGNALVIVDTISGFSTYHKANVICQFVANLSDKARKRDYTILWVAIDDAEGKALNNKLSQLCDKVVRV